MALTNTRPTDKVIQTASRPQRHLSMSSPSPAAPKS
jgi:hypothetical protein